jgi:DnaK suppressor protein
MDVAQKNELKKILEKTIEETEVAVSSDKVALESFEYKSGDTFDRAKSAAEVDLIAKLQDHRQIQLRKLRYALKELHREDFGDCEACGRDIGFDRLLILPTTTMCISCKEVEEIGTRKSVGHVEVAQSAMTQIFKE